MAKQEYDNIRVSNKNDIRKNWDKSSIIPLDGELLIYNPDKSNKHIRIKFGDGVHHPKDLPFFLGVEDGEKLVYGVGEPYLNGGEIFNDYENNIALGEHSSASGYNTSAGGKGFNINNINKSNELYYITISDISGMNIGDKFSLDSEKLDENFDLCGEVKNFGQSGDGWNLCASIQGVKDGLETIDGTTTEYIWFPYKPNLNGDRNLGEGAAANGDSTKAVMVGSHAEGYNTVAGGKYAHAEGNSTFAGYASHAEGRDTIAIGNDSHTEGRDTLASAHQSHAEGRSSKATGVQSHAEGQSTTASGIYAHAEGNSTISSANATHAEGSTTQAIAAWAHSEGRLTKARGISSHAEGNSSITDGENSHAEGSATLASGKNSHAEGSNTRAIKNNSHAEGEKTTADGFQSHAEGGGTNLKEDITSSTIPSEILTAFNTSPFSYVGGNYAHGEGFNTIALGGNSHAEGRQTIASKSQSHSEGYLSKATGNNSHAEGYNTTASGEQSHAGGSSAVASGTASFSHGIKTIASVEAQIAIGKYNTENNNALFIVGNGTGDSNRKNAFTVNQNGEISYCTNNVTITFKDDGIYKGDTKVVSF